MGLGIAVARDPQQGGVYQYSQLALHALAKGSPRARLEPVSVIATGADRAALTARLHPAWREVELHSMLSSRRLAPAVRALVGETAVATVASWVRRREASAAGGG